VKWNFDKYWNAFDRKFFAQEGEGFWFAWFPVKLRDSDKWCWCEKVWRVCEWYDTGYDGWYMYKKYYSEEPSG